MKSISCFFVFFAFLLESISAFLIPRIIGGQNAEITVFPYQASLRVRGTHLCGGCIISSRHILTAAHCITHNDFVGVVWPSPEVTVVTGTSSLTQNGNTHNVVKVAVHPGWRGIPGTSGINDIAVLTLARKIQFDNRQLKVNLPKNDITSDDVGLLTGWGRTTPTGQLSDQLQRLTMRIYNYTDCQVYHVDKELFKEQLCAFHSIGHGSCYGDSGGPLVIGNEVVGILSWVTAGCFGGGTAELFTNVYAHKDFIKSEMKSR